MLLCAVLRQHWGELTGQAGKACPAWGLVRHQERASISRHVNLVLSMEGKEREFHVPGLCSAGPSLNSGSPNLANPLMDLLLLPVKTFGTRSAEIRSRFVGGNQGGVFLFEEVPFLKMFSSSTLHFVIALLNPFFKNQ